MDKFAFVIHPITIEDVTRKFPVAKHLPQFVVERALRLLPPFKVSDITGVKSSHQEITGEFIACPLTSGQLLGLPGDVTLQKIIHSVKLAEKNGARIVGLGAFTSVVGDAGITVAKNVGIPVTTGNSYTVYTALEGTRKAAQLMNMEWPKANIVILGATGSIGSVCAQFIARENRYLTLVARQQSKLEGLASKLLYEYGVAVKITSNTREAIRKADIIIAVTSSLDAVVHPEDLKPGSIVCDVARPRAVSYRVALERDDVLVIEGGVVDVPGEPDFHFNFGFPPGKAYACMAETMILTLEKKLVCFSLGREMTIEQVEEMGRLAKKHGFKLSGFRSFERALTMEEISRIKDKAQRAQLKLTV
jgi:predicted amino acid dehydrogenase